MAIGTILAISAGVAATASAISLAKSSFKRSNDDKQNVLIQPIERKITIKCHSLDIPLERFHFNTYIRGGKMFFKIEGQKRKRVVNRVYRMKNISPDDIKNMTYEINGADRLVITIPITKYSDDMSVSLYSLSDQE